MGTQLVRVQKSATLLKPKTVSWWQRRGLVPWHSYCDMRALAAVVIQLHVESSAKSWVTQSDMVSWVQKGNYRHLKPQRKADVINAFTGRRDIKDMVITLIRELFNEEVLQAKWNFTGNDYRICLEDIDILNAAHARMIDEKKGSKNRLRPVK